MRVRWGVIPAYAGMTGRRATMPRRGATRPEGAGFRLRGNGQ